LSLSIRKSNCFKMRRLISCMARSGRNGAALSGEISLEGANGRSLLIGFEFIMNIGHFAGGA